MRDVIDVALEERNTESEGRSAIGAKATSGERFLIDRLGCQEPTFNDDEAKDKAVRR